jgi:hypothetical protein
MGGSPGYIGVLEVRGCVRSMIELDMAAGRRCIDDAMTTASQCGSQSQITALEATQTPSTGEVDGLRKPIDDVKNGFVTIHVAPQAEKN